MKEITDYDALVAAFDNSYYGGDVDELFAKRKKHQTELDAVNASLKAEVDMPFLRANLRLDSDVRSMFGVSDFHTPDAVLVCKTESPLCLRGYNSDKVWGVVHKPARYCIKQDGVVIHNTFNYLAVLVFFQRYLINLAYQ